MVEVKTLKEQMQVIDELFEDRLDTLIEPLMEECGLDMWIIPAKEYNEDPLLKFLTPSGFPTARRLTILVFVKARDGVKRYCVNRHYPELDKYYENRWNDESQTQWEALSDLIMEYNPETIGLNYSEHFAYCDGLTKGIFDEMVDHLSQDIVDRFTSAEMMGIRFLETRSARECELYPEVMQLAIDIISEAFSREVITPGVTTTSDVEWWMMQRVNRLGLPFWFPPTIDLQRQGVGMMFDTVIQPGDLLHCDFGITYFNLCTDTQRLAYVLKPGETKLPQDLKDAFKEGNKFQDIVRSNFQIGRSGNEVFTRSILEAKEQGIRPMLYTHPCGFHGHAAGPTIGLYNEQRPIPVQGDLELHDRTAYALELNIKKELACWDHQDVSIFLEETVLYQNGTVSFLNNGRDQIYLIK